GRRALAGHGARAPGADRRGAQPGARARRRRRARRAHGRQRRRDQRRAAARGLPPLGPPGTRSPRELVMRIGLQIPIFTWPGGAAALSAKLREIALPAEEAGFASIWVMDHFFQIPMVGAAEQEMLEGYAALSYLAGVTQRAKLGTMVTGVTYRHPGVLLKTVTTLDVLSGGRAYLGIGAAWFEREHVGLGGPFPPLAQRFESVEEP